MSALTKFVKKRPDVVVAITAVLMMSTAAALVYILTQCQRDDDEQRPCKKVTGIIESPDWSKRLKTLTDNGNDSGIFNIVSRNWDFSEGEGNTCQLVPIASPEGAVASGNYYGTATLNVLWDEGAHKPSLVATPPGSLTASVGDDGVVTFETGAHFAFFMQVVRSAISTDTASETSSAAEACQSMG